MFGVHDLHLFPFPTHWSLFCVTIILRVESPHSTPHWDATLVRLQLLSSMSQRSNVLAEPRNAKDQRKHQSCYPLVIKQGNGKSPINGQ